MGLKSEKQIHQFNELFNQANALSQDRKAAVMAHFHGGLSACIVMGKEQPLDVGEIVLAFQRAVKYAQR